MTAAASPEVLWRPLPGFQTRFLQRAEFEVLGGGAAGPGKTDALVVDAIRDAHQPWYAGLFVRRTLPELKEVIRRTQALYSRLFPDAVWRDSDKEWIFPEGGFLRFAYVERYEDATRHQGAEYTALFADEIGLLKHEDAYLFLLSRVRTPLPEARPYLRIRCSANPGGPGHGWIKRRFVDPTQGGKVVYTDEGGLTRAFVPGRLDENPYLSPQYRAQLDMLPELLRRALRDGDWDVGLSSAFVDLDRQQHMVPPFDPPEGWPQFAGHDWGFTHNAVTVWCCEGYEGERYVLDTVWARRAQPDQIAERVWESIPIDHLTLTYAGPDCWAEHQARGGVVPTIADQYLSRGWVCAPAATARVAGYQHLSNLLAWRGRGPDGGDIVPRLRFCDTPGNRRLFAQLQTLTVDPDDPRDVFKEDADLTTGAGGDDAYDALRYAMATYTRTPVVEEAEIRPFDRAVLESQSDRERRGIRTAPVPPRASGRSAEGLWEVS